MVLIDGIDINVLFDDIKRAKSILQTEINYDKRNNLSVANEINFGTPNDVHNDLMYVSTAFCNPSISLATNISVNSHGFTTMHYNGQDKLLNTADTLTALNHLSELKPESIIKRVKENKKIMRK